MEKGGIVFGVFLVSLVLAVSVVVLAKPSFSAPNDVVPAHAVQVSEGVFSLGTARDVDGRLVEGFAFVTPRKEAGHLGAGDLSHGPKCYKFLARGARWKTTEPYVTNTSTGVNLTLTETSLNTWDSEIPLFNIFGTGSSGTTNGSDLISPDGVNEVEFQNLGAGGPIAFTSIWGIFRGPPSGRELVEWDATFNTAFTFGDFNGSEEVMDYQNIATHEFGHAAGLAHPSDKCIEETMFRLADFNETNKRDLNAGDIKGINRLY